MQINLMWNQSLGKIPTNLYGHLGPNYTVSAQISSWPTVPNLIRCYCWFDYKQNKYVIHPCNPASTQPVKIAFIVESPHKDEFTPLFSPLRPLNGRAGRSFDRHIEEKMAIWFSLPSEKIKVYEIKIFNPVPYQTSLHHFLNNLIPHNKLSDELPPQTAITKYSLNERGANYRSTIRDAVWKVLFTSQQTNCKRNFLDEIIRYWPNYVINACTGESSFNSALANWNVLSVNNPRTPNPSLKDLVRESLYEYSEDFLTSLKYKEEEYPLRWKK